MKQEINKSRLTVFVEEARLVPEEEIAAIEERKRASVADKNGIWIEVACPEGACSLDKDRITLPASGVTSKETKGMWLSLFCPENQCQFYQATDAP